MDVILFVYVLSGIVSSIGVYEFLSEEDFEESPMTRREYIIFSSLIFVPVLNSICATMYLVGREEKGG